jgi:ribosomal protein S18 acetylase RimI-like enzyme
MDRLVRTAVPCRATLSDAGDLARLFAVAFHTDPIFNWMARNDGTRLPALQEFFHWILTERSISYGEVWMTDGAAAIWLPPGAAASPGGFFEQLKLLPLFMRVCGISRLLRGAALAGAMEKNHPHEPHYYLGFIAVAPECQGQGLGSALLSATLERIDAAGAPAYLENSNPRNTPLYERHGFVAGKNIAPKGAPPMMAMWRKAAYGSNSLSQ